ncbi:MAG: helix-turn-helix domain-containing protein [Streptosporangiaceae bacterium]
MFFIRVHRDQCLEESRIGRAACSHGTISARSASDARGILRLNPIERGRQGSRVHHLKELRPGSAGRSEIRVLFAFDATRSALLLLGGDKAGNWQRWYRQNIRAPSSCTWSTPQSRRSSPCLSAPPLDWEDLERELRAAGVSPEEIEAGARQLLAQARGHQLAQTRKDLGLGQKQIAAAMGVSVARVSQIEHGEVTSFEVIARYVEALGGRLDLVADFGDRTVRLPVTDTATAA